MKSEETSKEYCPLWFDIDKLKETYNLDVSVDASEEIKPGKFKLEILKTYE